MSAIDLTDAPPWAVALVDEVRQLRQIVAAAQAPAAAVQTMLSARGCDQRYRLRAGTARRAYDAGQIRGQVRPGRSATGEVLWIRADDAERLWGAK